MAAVQPAPGPAGHDSLAAASAGLGWLATAGCGAWLGHRRWHDADGLWHAFVAACSTLQADGWVTVLALALAGLIASAGIGGLSRAVGRALLALWLTGAGVPGAGRLVRARQERWQSADRFAAEAEERADEEAYERFARRRRAVGAAEPRRPTWMGDQIAAVDARVRGQYGVDLASAWPRLWLLLPDPARAAIREASAAWSRAGRLAGWGLIYALTGLWWWPGALIGAAVFAAGWWRGRREIAAFAVTIEAAVDLFGTDLATALHVPVPHGRLDAAAGREIAALLRKGT